jgi:hypothetical protein
MGDCWWLREKVEKDDNEKVVEHVGNRIQALIFYSKLPIFFSLKIKNSLLVSIKFGKRSNGWRCKENSKGEGEGDGDDEWRKKRAEGGERRRKRKRRY